MSRFSQWIPVKLTDHEIRAAEGLGRARYRASRDAKLMDVGGGSVLSNDKYRLDRIGMIGEWAYYKYVDHRYKWFTYATPETFRLLQTNPDFGDDIQVKCGSKMHYSLLVPENGNPQHRFVSTLFDSVEFKEDPVVWIVGWEWGEACMVPEYWCVTNVKEASYTIEPAKLRPMSTWDWTI